MYVQDGHITLALKPLGWNHPCTRGSLRARLHGISYENVVLAFPRNFSQMFSSLGTAGLQLFEKKMEEPEFAYFKSPSLFSGCVFPSYLRSFSKAGFLLRGRFSCNLAGLIERAQEWHCISSFPSRNGEWALSFQMLEARKEQSPFETRLCQPASDTLTPSIWINGSQLSWAFTADVLISGGILLRSGFGSHVTLGLQL